jgi:hypothetical protein
MCAISRLLFRNEALAVDGTYLPPVICQVESSRKNTLFLEAIGNGD